MKITATPITPTATPMTFAFVIFSLGRKNHARMSPNTVIVAWSTAANPEVIYCSLQNTAL